MFSISAFLDSFGPLLMAARYTLLVSVHGIGLGLVLGTLIVAARLSSVAVLRRFAATWVSFLRGVPLLVQLLLVYYLLPVIGIDVPALAAAVLTVGVCASVTKFSCASAAARVAMPAAIARAARLAAIIFRVFI